MLCKLEMQDQAGKVRLVGARNQMVNRLNSHFHGSSIFYFLGHCKTQTGGNASSIVLDNSTLFCLTITGGCMFLAVVVQALHVVVLTGKAGKTPPPSAQGVQCCLRLLLVSACAAVHSNHLSSS